MTHDPHEFLPGFSAAQVLHDGCTECKERSQQPDRGISNLDPEAFGRAWRRAAARGKRGLNDTALAEVPMFQALWAVQVQLERRGVPIGELPGE